MSILIAVLNSAKVFDLTLGDLNCGRDVYLSSFDAEDAVASSFMTKLAHPSMDEIQPTPLGITRCRKQTRCL